MAGYTERNVLFAVGGYDGQAAVGSMEVFDLTRSHGLWEVAEPMTQKRRAFGIAVLQNKLYIAGGTLENTSEGCTDSLDIFDLASQWWMQGPRMPSRRFDVALTACSGRLVAIGGRGEGKLSGATESFDPVTSQWDCLAPLLKPRAGLGVAAVDGAIYAIGGDLGTRKIQASGRVELLIDGSWLDAPAMQLERCDAAVVAIGHKIFVMGGYGGRHGAAGTTPTMEIFDSSSQLWSYGPGMLYARSGLSAAVVTSTDPQSGVQKSQIYVLGGAFAGVGATATQILDPEHTEWRLGPSLVTSRWGTRLASVSGEAVRTDREQREHLLRTRYAITEAIALRDVDKLAAAVEDGRRVGLDEGELAIPMAMLEKQARSGFMTNFEIPPLNISVS